MFPDCLSKSLFVKQTLKLNDINSGQFLLNPTPLKITSSYHKELLYHDFCSFAYELTVCIDVVGKKKVQLTNGHVDVVRVDT